MIKLLNRSTYCAAALFLFLGSQLSFAQTTTSTESLSVTGYDDDPLELIINPPANSFTVNQGEVITNLKINSIDLLQPTTGDSWGTETWCNSNYFKFSMEVNGTLVIDQQCLTPFINYDLTGANSIRIFSTDLDNDDDNIEMNVEFEVTYETPSCPQVTNLSATGTTSDASTIAWTAGSTETSWIVSWGLPGFTAVDQLGTQTVTTPTFTIPALDQSTAYEVRVIADCGEGDQSIATSTSFTTNCAPIVGLGFCEGFETTSNTLNCWTIIDANNDGEPFDTYYKNEWVIVDNSEVFGITSNTGNQFALINTDYNNGANDDYLITPNLSLAGQEMLTFKYRVRASGEPNDFRVLLSTTGNNAADFTTEIMPLTLSSNTEYATATVYLEQFAGQNVYIAFHIPADGLDGWMLGIDDVCIEQAPNCIPANSLTTTNITSNSIDIAWTPISNELSWTIEWGTPGFTPGAGLGTQTVTTPTFTITNLDEQTDYSITVITNCADDEQSEVVTLDATTNCAPIAASGFCESFESDSETLGCWKIIDANQDAFDGFLYDEYTWSIMSSDEVGEEISNTGDQAAYIYTDYNDGANDDYLITPNLTIAANQSLSFYYKSGSTFETNDFRVLLSTTGNNPADFTEIIMPLTVAENDTFNLEVIDLNAYAGQDVYIAFHIPAGGEDGYLFFIDDVCIQTCDPFVTDVVPMTICRGEEVGDLSNSINTTTPGTWISTQFQQLIEGSNLNVASIYSGTYQFGYIMSNACTSDTVYTTVQISDENNAGENGLITACKNETINLTTGITSTFDTGGIWLSADNTQLTSSTIQVGNLQGQFIYKYIVDNGNCEPDTAKITVNITSCDFLSIEELAFEKVTLSPNPTNGLFQIAGLPANEELTIVVTDLNGKTVETRTIANQSTIQLDLSNVNSGVYFVNIDSKDANKMMRLVKN